MPSFPDKVAQLGMDPTLAKTLQDNIGGNRTAVQALVPLTDSSGGTPSNTIVDVPGTYTEATLANQLASLTAKVNAIIAAIKT